MRSAQNNPYAPLQYGALEKITDRVYLFRNIVNSSIVVGEKGVAVIDTQVNQRMACRVLHAVRSITDKTDSVCHQYPLPLGPYER